MPTRTPTPALVPALVVAAVLLLTGCAAAPAPAPAGDGDAHAELPTAGPSPTWDTGAATDAAQVAHDALAAFVRSDLDQAAWQAQLQPWFTPTAWADYQWVDLAEVPAGRVLAGPGQLTATEAGTPFLASVPVPTDIGTYTVLLSRTGAGAPWLVEQLTPPQEQP